MSRLGVYIVSKYIGYGIYDTCLFIIMFRFGIGLFMYQSLDAIDGKQARRTQTSGPLGELFDHGKIYLF